MIKLMTCSSSKKYLTSFRHLAQFSLLSRRKKVTTELSICKSKSATRSCPRVSEDFLANQLNFNLLQSQQTSFGRIDTSSLSLELGREPLSTLSFLSASASPVLASICAHQQLQHLRTSTQKQPVRPSPKTTVLHTAKFLKKKLMQVQFTH